MMTIRRQLLAGLLSATVACAAGGGATLYHSLRIETNELADQQLRQLAAALPDQMAAGVDQPIPGEPEEEFDVQVWDANHALLYASRPHLPLMRYDLHGYASIMAQGELVRVYGTILQGHYIQISQPASVRDAMAAHLMLQACLPLLAFVGLLVMLVLVVVGSATRPIERLTRAVAARSGTALHRLEMDGWPADLAPVVRALNELLDRFSETLAVQRTFIADAAHELRSPLTALKLQLQLLESAETPQARADAIEKLRERLDRSVHLVRQLLNLARSEAADSGAALAPLSLDNLLRDVAAEHSAQADSRHIDLGVEAPQPVTVAADPDSLRVLLNNLVVNALNYIDEGGRIDLVARMEDGCPVLWVADDGPGIPADQYQRVFDRFYRIEGSRSWGCGLGLSIVRHIAQRHGASVTLGPGLSGRGLGVTVRFPPC